MRATILSLICLAAIGNASPASSQGCDRSDETQSGMNICADADYRQEDAKLNQKYGQIVTRLADDAEGRKLLKEAQRAWIAFRDAECTFSTNASSDGSIYPMLVSQCRADLTRARVDQLETYLGCEEGDMSCPVPPAP